MDHVLPIVSVSRYGYRRITALLKRTGWQVGKDRVERIWRREGLKVPQKQKPRGRLWRDEFLNGEIFYSLKEVQVLAERWRIHDNTVRPHSALGYRSPAPEAWALQTNLTGRGELGIATPFPTLYTHPAAIQILQKLRYTNNPTGTKDRARHRNGD